MFMRQYMYISHVLYLGFTQVIWTHDIAVWQIRYIGFRQVIRVHITCLWEYKTQTGYMSPYYLSKAYITNNDVSRVRSKRLNDHDYYIRFWLWLWGCWACTMQFHKNIETFVKSYNSEHVHDWCFAL